MRFAEAYRAELASWKGLNLRQRYLIMAFNACVSMRMRGLDVDTIFS